MATKNQNRTCRKCRNVWSPADKDRAKTCPTCRSDAKRDKDLKKAAKARARELKRETTREVKALRTPEPPTPKTRKTHPHLWHDPKRNGEPPEAWTGSGRGVPCPKCDRVLDDQHGQVVTCGGIQCGKAYLGCSICFHRWTLPVKKPG